MLIIILFRLKILEETGLIANADEEGLLQATTPHRPAQWL